MIKEKRSYKTIRWVLRSHIKNKVNSLWTWENDNFTNIYKNYGNKDNIFTAVQLLNQLETKEK